MSKMQRDKGARYERLISKLLAPLFPNAVRGNQKMGAFQPDIIIDDYWVECTHGKAPRVSAKIKQANKDLTECNEEHRHKEMLVIHRKDNGSDYATVRLDHFLMLLEEHHLLRCQTYDEYVALLNRKKTSVPGKRNTEAKEPGCQ